MSFIFILLSFVAVFYAVPLYKILYYTVRMCLGVWLKWCFSIGRGAMSVVVMLGLSLVCMRGRGPAARKPT